MFDIILLNLIFIIVPILCYLLYLVYENTIDSKTDNLFFNLAIITSLYLITKYSKILNYNLDIVKILLLISMIKNKKILSIFIAIYISFLSYPDINKIVLLLFEYVIQLSIFFVFLKKLDYKYKIIMFLIIEILCGISINSSIYYTLLSNIICIFITYIIVIMLEKLEKVLNLYGTIKEVEHDKNFRESLFKVTHEIKNPIAVCKGYLDMLDLNDNKKVNEYIPIVKDEINRTLILMNDFLNLTKLKVNKEVMDINMLLEDIISSVEPLLLTKNIHLISNINDDELFINGDYDRLKQVFINLIKNSIESIDSDIGIIKLNIKDKKNVEINLIDNGSGIKKGVLDKLGEPFITTKEKGTGLGVKLSKEIIELHNGKIKYLSKEKEGTTVKIVLPKLK